MNIFIAIPSVFRVMYQISSSVTVIVGNPWIVGKPNSRLVSRSYSDHVNNTSERAASPKGRYRISKPTTLTLLNNDYGASRTLPRHPAIFSKDPIYQIVAQKITRV